MFIRPLANGRKRKYYKIKYKFSTSKVRVIHGGEGKRVKVF